MSKPSELTALTSAGAAMLGDQIPRLGVIRCLLDFAAGSALAVPWPLMAGYALIVLAASFALYRWVERPAQAWINALRLSVRSGRLPAPR